MNFLLPNLRDKQSRNKLILNQWTSRYVSVREMD